MTGAGPDLMKLTLFLEAVTSGHNSADALRDLHLDTIRITSTRGSRGRGARITLTLQLTEAAQ